MTSDIYFLYRFGILGFGVYPLGLELSVEASYPVDEAAGTALIFLSGQVQGGILVLFAQILAQDLNEEAQEIEVRFTHFETVLTWDYRGKNLGSIDNKWWNLFITFGMMLNIFVT